MTDTIRKRAERQRRREEGYKRVECWVTAEEQVQLKTIWKGAASESLSYCIDKIDGLQTDLRMAVLCAYLRGAKDWAVLNYPAWREWLESHEDYAQ